MRSIILLACAVSLTACGGRVAHPVSSNLSIDDKLSCDHLWAEYENNLKRVAELAGERGESNRDNAGMLLVSPLLIDLGNTERKEIDAIKVRNSRLGELAAGRQCSNAPAMAMKMAPAASPVTASSTGKTADDAVKTPQP